MAIHPTAIVDRHAELDSSVEVGPYAVIGPKVKRGFKSQVVYHHENLLRTVCDALGFASCPGAGANAKPMSDFF